MEYKIDYSILFIFFIINSTLSESIRCANLECQVIISKGRTTQRYPSTNEDILSSQIDEVVLVYGKAVDGSQKDTILWDVEINSKRGLFPSRFIKEDKIYFNMEKLIKVDFSKHRSIAHITLEKISSNNKSIDQSKDGIALIGDDIDYETLMTGRTLEYENEFDDTEDQNLDQTLEPLSSQKDENVVTNKNSYLKNNSPDLHAGTSKLSPQLEINTNGHDVETPIDRKNHDLPDIGNMKGVGNGKNINNVSIPETKGQVPSKKPNAAENLNKSENIVDTVSNRQTESKDNQLHSKLPVDPSKTRIETGTQPKNVDTYQQDYRQQETIENPSAQQTRDRTQEQQNAFDNKQNSNKLPTQKNFQQQSLDSRVQTEQIPDIAIQTANINEISNKQENTNKVSNEQQNVRYESPQLHKNKYDGPLSQQLYSDNSFQPQHDLAETPQETPDLAVKPQEIPYSVVNPQEKLNLAGEPQETQEFAGKLQEGQDFVRKAQAQHFAGKSKEPPDQVVKAQKIPDIPVKPQQTPNLNVETQNINEINYEQKNTKNASEQQNTNEASGQNGHSYANPQQHKKYNTHLSEQQAIDNHFKLELNAENNNQQQQNAKNTNRQQHNTANTNQQQHNTANTNQQQHNAANTNQQQHNTANTNPQQHNTENTNQQKYNTENTNQQQYNTDNTNQQQQTGEAKSSIQQSLDDKYPPVQQQSQVNGNQQQNNAHIDSNQQQYKGNYQIPKYGGYNIKEQLNVDNAQKNYGDYKNKPKNLNYNITQKQNITYAQEIPNPSKTLDNNSVNKANPTVELVTEKNQTTQHHPTIGVGIDHSSATGSESKDFSAPKQHSLLDIKTEVLTETSPVSEKPENVINSLKHGTDNVTEPDDNTKQTIKDDNNQETSSISVKPAEKEADIKQNFGSVSQQNIKFNDGTVLSHFESDQDNLPNGEYQKNDNGKKIANDKYAHLVKFVDNEDAPQASVVEEEAKLNSIDPRQTASEINGDKEGKTDRMEVDEGEDFIQITPEGFKDSAAPLEYKEANVSKDEEMYQKMRKIFVSTKEYILRAMQPILGDDLGYILIWEIFNSKMSIGSAALLLIISGTIVLLYLLHLCVMKMSKEAPLLKEMNDIKREMRFRIDENMNLRNKLSDTNDQILTANMNSIDSAATAAIQDELLQTKERCSRIVQSYEEKILIVEQELEESTSNGTEMHKMLNELLQSQKDSTNFQASVDILQNRLDAQKVKVETLTTDLAMKTHLNEEMLTELKSNKDKIRKLDYQIEQLSNALQDSKTSKRDASKELQAKELQIKKLEEAKSNLSKEVENTKVKIDHLTERGESLQIGLKNVKTQLNMKDAEILVSKECCKKLQKTTQKNVNLSELFGVIEIKTNLKVAEKQKATIQNELEISVKEKDKFCANLSVIEKKIEKFKKDKEAAILERDNAVSKLNVLTDYFKEKEAEYTKELESQEHLRIDAEGSFAGVENRIQNYEIQLTSYRSKLDSIKVELDDQMQSYKMQLSDEEKKSHDNWIKARSADRRVEELRKENSQLRQRLTMMTRDDHQSMFFKPLPNLPMDANGSVSSPISTDGDVDRIINSPLDMDPLLRPLPMPFAPMPFPGRMHLPPHPSMMGPFPPLPDRRLPPAGRIASPSFRRHNSPPRYNRRSYSPSSDYSNYSDQGYSPPLFNTSGRYSPSRRRTMPRSEHVQNDISSSTPRIPRKSATDVNSYTQHYSRDQHCSEKSEKSTPTVQNER